jgi:hypothetical protein
LQNLSVGPFPFTRSARRTTGWWLTLDALSSRNSHIAVWSLGISRVQSQITAPFTIQAYYATSALSFELCPQRSRVCYRVQCLIEYAQESRQPSCVASNFPFTSSLEDERRIWASTLQPTCGFLIFSLLTIQISLQTLVDISDDDDDERGAHCPRTRQSSGARSPSRS